LNEKRASFRAGLRYPRQRGLVPLTNILTARLSRGGTHRLTLLTPLESFNEQLEGKRMSSTADIFLKATLVGVGGTIVLDLYALMMSRVLGVPATNWAMVGRWFGNMAHGQFVQVAMSEAAPVKGELAIGWIAHYAIGIGYGLLLLALWGKVWLERPTLIPPMILAWVLLVAPYFMMMPGMGMGIAESRTGAQQSFVRV
jgi:Protein of unknown function (DUF2938)